MSWRATICAIMMVPGFLLGTMHPAAADGVAEPEGYRLDLYRAPVPDTLQGAEVVDDAAALALWQGGAAAFIDVMPRIPKPANLPEGTLWLEKPRRSIEGAIWLPNVGYGALSALDEAYLRHGLQAATGGDVAKPVLFFCQMDCWMSWNAAKRALEYGYERVMWYPYGMDGWLFEEGPSAIVQPYPQPEPASELAD